MHFPRRHTCESMPCMFHMNSYAPNIKKALAQCASVSCATFCNNVNDPGEAERAPSLAFRFSTVGCADACDAWCGWGNSVLHKFARINYSHAKHCIYKSALLIVNIRRKPPPPTRNPDGLSAFDYFCIPSIWLIVVVSHS